MLSSLISRFRSTSGDNKKLSRDVLWTTGSFFILAISGVVINLSVVAFRDASALGVFNLAYAVYIVVSQVAVMGVHYSVLRSSAHFDGDPDQRRHLLWTAILMSTVLGVLFGVGVYCSEEMFVQLFDSAEASRAIAYAGLGLCLFPLNKVLVSYINGIRHMRAFSVLQASRYLLVMAWVAFVAASKDIPFELASLAFLLAESVTALAALLHLAVAGKLGWPCIDYSWMKKHAHFGIKSLPSGMFLEVNTRVDVLVIGFFLGDREVGIYSFAAMLVDGLYHILAMIRVNLNPILVAAKRDLSWSRAQALLAVSKKYLMYSMFGLSVLTIAGYCVVVQYILGTPELLEGAVPLAVLLLGLSVVSTYIPFDNLLMVSGYPGYQAWQNFVVVVANVALNFLLVPFLGIAGAAIATAISYVVGFIVLMLLVRKFLGWNLFTNKMIGE